MYIYIYMYIYISICTYTCILFISAVRIYIQVFGGGVERVGLYVCILIYIYACSTDIFCNVGYAASRCGWRRFELLAIRKRHFWNLDSVWIAFSELYRYAHPHTIHTNVSVATNPCHVCIHNHVYTFETNVYMHERVYIYFRNCVWENSTLCMSSVSFVCMCVQARVYVIVCVGLLVCILICTHTCEVHIH